MSHPVFPTFPTSPAPTIGQTFTDGNGAVWVFGNIGWAKKTIVLTSDYPIYEGLMVNTSP
jgi:hypothetical protein